MARKNKKQANKNQDQIELIMRHAYALNLHSIDAYQDWCLEQGYSNSLKKSKSVLEREYRDFIAASAASKLHKHKHESNMCYQIDRIYKNKVKERELDSAILKEISAAFKRTNRKHLLRNVLVQLSDNTKLMSHIDYVKGVIGFVTLASFWLRSIDKWIPKTRNAGRQFSSLARYLFANYDVPAFMDNVWQGSDSDSKHWFIHIGSGKNIRSAPSLPITMTKKMAHHFSLAPANYTVNAAFRWAQVHALGGNKSTADAVAGTRLVRTFNDDDFWLSVIRFFIENPMLAVSEYNPIVDFIWHKKYEARIVFIERGVVRDEGPEQPNFSMHGRTAESLLRQVELWHRQLGRESRGGLLQWVKSRYNDFRYVEGKAKSKTIRIWTISELLSSKELTSEGRKQHHCVSSYARTCYSGTTSIWTMHFQDGLSEKKMLTIEVHNLSGTIRQVRGLYNRLATSSEMNVIRRWGVQEGLSLSGYI